MPAQDHYAVLALRRTDDLSPPALKRAYHRALLLHHPDKTSGSPAITPGHTSNGKVTVDQIALAFATLRDPVLRAEYDRSLATSSGAPASERLTGLDVVDLDDLAYDEEGNVWRRACRCGHTDGFVVREEQLEEAAARGEAELLVGCQGCSLWLMVGFAVAENEDGA